MDTIGVVNDIITTSFHSAIVCGNRIVIATMSVHFLGGKRMFKAGFLQLELYQNMHARIRRFSSSIKSPAFYGEIMRIFGVKLSSWIVFFRSRPLIK